MASHSEEGRSNLRERGSTFSELITDGGVGGKKGSTKYTLAAVNTNEQPGQVKSTMWGTHDLVVSEPKRANSSKNGEFTCWSFGKGGEKALFVLRLESVREFWTSGTSLVMV